MKGFRKQFLNAALEVIKFLGVLVLIVVLWALIFVLFLPEFVVAFFVALFKDEWQMWVCPALKKAAKKLWDIDP